MRPIPKRSAAVSIALGLLAVGSPAAEAGAASPSPPAPSPGPAQPVAPLAPDALPSLPRLSFSPPEVGEISVAIGPIILGGKMINPGLKVTKPAVSLEPSSPPAVPQPVH
jgi:hypothetical protein